MINNLWPRWTLSRWLITVLKAFSILHKYSYWSLYPFTDINSKAFYCFFLFTCKSGCNGFYLGSKRFQNPNIVCIWIIKSNQTKSISPQNLSKTHWRLRLWINKNVKNVKGFWILLQRHFVHNNGTDTGYEQKWQNCLIRLQKHFCLRSATFTTFSSVTFIQHIQINLNKTEIYQLLLETESVHLYVSLWSPNCPCLFVL